MFAMMKSSLAFAPQSGVMIHEKQTSLLSLTAHNNRRQIVQSIIATTATTLVTNYGSSAVAEVLENGLLESRVLENVLSPPPYGMEGTDVFYPSYFTGVWNVDSKTTEIQAPCGVLLFGGNRTYDRAQTEVNTSLRYKARFVTAEPSNSIADREYNVVEIAKAAMGTNAVLNVPLATPNKISVVLSPNGANQILTADLLTLNRRAEVINDCEFHCSEVVRQVIAPAKQQQQPSPTNLMAPPPPRLLKEIETASLYRAIRDSDGMVRQIKCRQRSATFLLPSQQDPMANQAWEATRGRPIDVRFYDVVYTKA